MRVFRTSYKDKTGQKRQAAKWYVELRDHLQIVRRFPAFTDKRQSEALGRQIEKLVNFKIAGQQPDTELSKWLENIPGRLRNQLVRIGLLDMERAAAGKLLAEHVEDFRQALLAKGNTTNYVKLTVTRIKQVFNVCKFNAWTDVSASRVQRYLAALREEKEGISVQTFNYYLQAVKQFSRWMVDDRRASESPLAYLKPIKITVREKNRRALSIEQLRHLLEVTTMQPVRYGMTGYDRYVLYRVAAETGLRANELRSLKVSSFNLVERTVTVEAAYSKRRRRDVVDLKADTCELLGEYFSGKLPDARVFRGRNSQRLTDKTAKMLRADLKAAGLPYTDDDGRDFDFHALRHQYGTLLDQTDCTLKERQERMRHSDIKLTMKYTHTPKGRSGTTEQMADLNVPGNDTQEAKATGTEGAKTNLAENLALSCGKQRISADTNGQIAGEKAHPEKIQKSFLEAKKPIFTGKKKDSENTPGVTRTRDLRIRNPLLYPTELRA